MSQGEIVVKDGKVQSVRLSTRIFKQGSQIVIHSDSLDFCTSGDTIEQARANFHDAIHIFLEDLFEQGTLQEILLELGWSEQEDSWIPPAWECREYDSMTHEMTSVH